MTEHNCCFNEKELVKRERNVINILRRGRKALSVHFKQIAHVSFKGRNTIQGFEVGKASSQIAQMKIPKDYTRKLDDRSKSVVYLRKEPGTKARRLFDPHTGKLNVSRDVVFEESKS